MARPVAELSRQIKGAQEFKAKPFKVHADTDAGQRVDRSTGSTFVPLSDVMGLTSAARVPAFLDGTPKKNPDKDPLSSTHGYKTTPVYEAPSGPQDPNIGFSQRPNIAEVTSRESTANQNLTNLENTTLAGFRTEVWHVPGSSESPERVNATLFDKNGGSWNIFREVNTATRNTPHGEQISSEVIGTMISLTHTDSKGNIRKYKANVPNPGSTANGDVTYSEEIDGKEIRFYNGSHIQKSAELASELVALDPADVILVKNNISGKNPITWANQTYPTEVIDQLFVKGRVDKGPQEMEIFDSSKLTRQTPAESNGPQSASMVMAGSTSR